MNPKVFCADQSRDIHSQYFLWYHEAESPPNSSECTAIVSIDGNALANIWPLTKPSPNTLSATFRLSVFSVGWGTGWLLATTAGRMSVSTDFKFGPSEPPTLHLSVLFFPSFWLGSHPRTIMFYPISPWRDAHWVGMVGISGCWVAVDFQEGDNFSSEASKEMWDKWRVGSLAKLLGIGENRKLWIVVLKEYNITYSFHGRSIHQLEVILQDNRGKPYPSVIWLGALVWDALKEMINQGGGGGNFLW